MFALLVLTPALISTEATDVRVAVLVDNKLTQAQAVWDFAKSELDVLTQQIGNSFTFSANIDATTSCTAGNAMEASVASLADFYYNRNITAVFGPTCFQDLEITPRLTEIWNIIQFNFWTDHPSDYLTNTLVQMTSRSSTNIAENLLALLLGADWRKVAFVLCPNCYSDIDDDTCTQRINNISQHLQDNGIEVTVTFTVYKNFTVADYAKELETLTTLARVVVPFLGSSLSDYNFLQLGMRLNNFTSDQYTTVITLYDYMVKSLDIPWTNDANLQEAFQKSVVLYNSNYDQKSVTDFVNQIGASDSQVLTYMHLVECLFVLNTILNSAKNAGIGDDLSASNLIENAVGDFKGPFGMITLNSQMHRIAPFTVLLVENGSLTTLQDTITSANSAQTCSSQCLRFTPPKVGFNGGMPTCGLNGELCDQTATIIIIAAVVLSSFVAIMLIVGVKKIMRRTTETTAMPWVVPNAAVRLMQLDGGGLSGSQHMSILSLQQQMDDPAKLQRFMQHHQLGTLDQVYIVVNRYSLKERLNFDKFDYSSLFNLKQLTHDNVNPFMGMSFDKPGELLILWTHCFRGSLADMIFNTKEDSGTSQSFVKSFKGAFVRDILKGLDYLHSSNIGYHGSLTPQHCHIDSHWILKLTGYGVNRMLYKWKNNNTISTVEGKPLIPNSELHYYSPETRKQLKHLMYTNKLEDIYSTNKFGQAADMFSFGIILYEIIYRKKYVDIEDVYHNDVEEENLILCEQAEAMIPSFVPVPTETDEGHVHPDLIGLMQRCWQSNLDGRPDAMLARKITDATLKISGSLVDQMIKNMEAYTLGLEDLVKERTGQLEEAQKKADELLSELLPRSVAEDLKMGRRVDAKNYKSVTIMYSDIVGFTSLCSESQPMEVVALLSGLFDKFDRIISQHDGYKMETIGDAYCVASGIPNPSKIEHVRNIATIALLQREWLTVFEIPHRPGKYLNCRWGFNTGPVFTGVVGIRAPRYSVFGQTVIIASKMENMGSPGRIQLTLNSQKLLSARYPEFKCVNRGGGAKIPGIGLLLTYWLEGVEDLLKSDRAAFDRAIAQHEGRDMSIFEKPDPPGVASTETVEPIIRRSNESLQ